MAHRDVARNAVSCSEGRCCQSVVGSVFTSIELLSPTVGNVIS